MSKELEALNKIIYSYGYDENIKIIATALEDYEMEHTLRIRLENANYELVREKQENEKKLKALEIIKKNPELVWWCCCYKTAEEMIIDRKGFMLDYSLVEIKEQFNKIKEWLENEN